MIINLKNLGEKWEKKLKQELRTIEQNLDWTLRRRVRYDPETDEVIIGNADQYIVYSRNGWGYTSCVFMDSFVCNTGFVGYIYGRANLVPSKKHLAQQTDFALIVQRMKRLRKQ